MENAIQEYREALEIADTPQEMALKLADMKTKLGLVQRFFKEVMIKDQDYGIIPGTDKPTLLKPGAEKLCELYGFAPIIKHVEEEKNIETGFYRARVTVALVHRRSGVVVAEGVGEANTMEGRYRWRWVPEWKLPEGVDRSGLYSEVRVDKNGKKYRMYRLENQDPWTLWNTVLKMAKKRGLIDATLSATRSSGIFTQDVEDLDEWVESAVEEVPEYKPSHTTQTNGKKVNPENARKAVFAAIKPLEDQYGKEIVAEAMRQYFGVEKRSDVPDEVWIETAKNMQAAISQIEQICMDISAAFEGEATTNIS